MNRRTFLELSSATPSAFAGAATITEDHPDNAKICHRINARQVTDEDLLFMKQIGLRWARLEFGDQDTALDYLMRPRSDLLGLVFGL